MSNFESSPSLSRDLDPEDVKKHAQLAKQLADVDGCLGYTFYNGRIYDMWEDGTPSFPRERKHVAGIVLGSIGAIYAILLTVLACVSIGQHTSGTRPPFASFSEGTHFIVRYFVVVFFGLQACILFLVGWCRRRLAKVISAFLWMNLLPLTVATVTIGWVVTNALKTYVVREGLSQKIDHSAGVQNTIVVATTVTVVLVTYLFVLFLQINVAKGLFGDAALWVSDIKTV